MTRRTNEEIEKERAAKAARIESYMKNELPVVWHPSTGRETILHAVRQVPGLEFLRTSICFMRVADSPFIDDGKARPRKCVHCLRKLAPPDGVKAITKKTLAKGKKT